MGSTKFAGYKWDLLSQMRADNEYKLRATHFLDTTSWDAVCRAASQLRSGRACKLESPVGLGGRHMVRVIHFEDGIDWIARLRMPSEVYTLAEQAEHMQREIDCMRFVEQNTNVPIPTVYGHNLSDTASIGAPTMFMECLRGNVGMDLTTDGIPQKYKESFYTEMARIQAEIASLQLPQIGVVVQQDDGSFTVGPLPGLGGPFSTAIEFFEAWASEAEFPEPEARIREGSGQYADEVLQSIEEFPPKLQRLAHRLISCNDGPFPLCHGDFGHNNIVVNDHYQVLGVIDWEDAYTAPWETMDYPLVLGHCPRSIDAPHKWDADGNPFDEQTRTDLEDQRMYVNAVRDAETALQHAHKLSEHLADENAVSLATSMRLFNVDGKMAFYSRALDYLEPQSE